MSRPTGGGQGHR